MFFLTDITRKPLVIGISARALFNMEAENKIFEEQGYEAYAAYQREHENDTLEKGPAFELVKAFLRLNELENSRLIDVIILSRTSPDTSLRIMKSIQEYELDISRAALVGGSARTPYLKAFGTDLFLSAYGSHVKQAIDNNIAAARILTGSVPETEAVGQIRIAFDGDAVLFAAESERIYQKQGLQAFIEHEKTHANQPMNRGPFANFLTTLSHLQGLFASGDASPIRTALVTSRNAQVHERAIRTLRDWNVRVDEAFFLGGFKKKDILSAFGAHIFFDDQEVHANPASQVVASAVVPYREGDNPMD